MARLTNPNFLKAWPRHRHLTQAELADTAGTRGVVIDLFEADKRGLSGKWRLRPAGLLEARPDNLTTSDPSKG